MRPRRTTVPIKNLRLDKRIETLKLDEPVSCSGERRDDERVRDVEMPARNLSPETRRGYTYDLSEWAASTLPSLPVAALSTAGIAR